MVALPVVGVDVKPSGSRGNRKPPGASSSLLGAVPLWVRSLNPPGLELPFRLRVIFRVGHRQRSPEGWFTRSNSKKNI